MRYRTLGRTGLRVSVVGVGTWQFGGEWNVDFTQPAVDAIFDAARETGTNLVDTAECYGDHLSESFVGAAVERDRDQWVIATKFGHKFTGFFGRAEPRRPEDIREQLEGSLKALRTDRIDVYQYHSWGDDTFFDEDVLATLHEAVRQGKVRHLANSVGSNRNVRQIEASERMKLEAIQIVYNRLDLGPEEGGAFDVCLRQNLGVLVRVPLASGLLSGKYKPGATFPARDPRSKQKPEDRERRLAEAQRILKDEVPPGVDPSTWALAWCLRHPAVSCVIPGVKSPEQMRSNAAAADLASDDHPQATR